MLCVYQQLCVRARTPRDVHVGEIMRVRATPDRRAVALTMWRVRNDTLAGGCIVHTERSVRKKLPGEMFFFWILRFTIGATWEGLERLTPQKYQF